MNRVCNGGWISDSAIPHRCILPAGHNDSCLCVCDRRNEPDSIDVVVPGVLAAFGIAALVVWALWWFA